MRPVVSHAAFAAAAIADDQREAARSNLGPLARVAAREGHAIAAGIATPW